MARDGPIVFDESEYSLSPLSDEVLRLVALFIDREAYDKLLYRKQVSYVRLTNRSMVRHISQRPKRIRNWCCCIRVVAAAPSKEAVEEVYSMAI